MSIDVVMPQGNEAELIELAEKLGFKEIIFLYDELYDDVKANVKGKPLNINSKKIKIHTAKLINNIKEVDKAKNNFDFVFAPAQRNFFENKKIKYLINAESNLGDDFLYQRRAGLDDVMCKLAKEKDKVIVFNTKLLDQSGKQNNILSRMMQNAKLCRKYKVKTLVATLASKPLEMRAPKELQGFARRLGVTMFVKYL